MNEMGEFTPEEERGELNLEDLAGEARDKAPMIDPEKVKAFLLKAGLLAGSVALGTAFSYGATELTKLIHPEVVQQIQESGRLVDYLIKGVGPAALIDKYPWMNLVNGSLITLYIAAKLKSS